MPGRRNTEYRPIAESSTLGSHLQTHYRKDLSCAPGRKNMRIPCNRNSNFLQHFEPGNYGSCWKVGGFRIRLDTTLWKEHSVSRMCTSGVYCWKDWPKVTNFETVVAFYGTTVAFYGASVTNYNASLAFYDASKANFGSPVALDGAYVAFFSASLRIFSTLIAFFATQIANFRS